MNMLYFLEEYRGRGYGTQMVSFWEKEMIKLGYDKVMPRHRQMNLPSTFTENSVIGIPAASFRSAMIWRSFLQGNYNYA